MRQNILTQISYTEIRAPVSGRIGSIPYKVGTILRIGDNTVTSVLATINQVDPIFVSFAIPQVFLPDLRAAMAKGEVKVFAVIDETHKQSGAMAFIENSVDPNTGTVTGKAKIANANEGLWPGQFVRPRSSWASSRRRYRCRPLPCSSARKVPMSSSSRTATWPKSARSTSSAHRTRNR